MQEKNASEIYKIVYIVRLYKNFVYLCAKNIKVQGSEVLGSKVQGLLAFGGLRVQGLRLFYRILDWARA
jgi:hypothetical protein